MTHPVIHTHVVFDDLQKAFGDVAPRHGITHEELGQAITYVQKLVESGDFLLATTLLVANRPIAVSYGRAYARPEKDGASTWMATGPAYVPGAPEIDNPGVLPMAPDEPGDTLFVSGVVRSTAGKAADRRGDRSLADHRRRPVRGSDARAGGTPGGPRRRRLRPAEIPPARQIVTDAEGRYEYRTVVPGVGARGSAGQPARRPPAHAGTGQLAREAHPRLRHP